MPLARISQTTLHFVDQGSGPAVVLVHGFPLDHRMWLDQIADLSRDFRVVAPDLRGFGLSRGMASALTMERFARDIDELLNHLAITSSVVLIGLSMGGYIAWQFWRLFPQRLSAMVLCNTRAAADTPEVAKGRQLMAQRVLLEGAQAAVDAMLDRLLAPHTPAEQPELVDSIRQIILQTDPETIAAAQHGMAQRPDMTDQLGHIHVPMLIVGGEHDAITPPDEMQTMAVALPDARFVVIQGAGHLAPCERPAEVNQAIRAFLATLPLTA